MSFLLPAFISLAEPQARGFEPAWPITTLLEALVWVLLGLFCLGESPGQVHPHSRKLLWSQHSHPLETPSPCGFATEGSPSAKALSEPCQDLPILSARCSVPPHCCGCLSFLQAFFQLQTLFHSVFLLMEGARTQQWLWGGRELLFLLQKD